MRQLVISIIVVCVCCFPMIGQAAEDEQSSLHIWKELNQTSDRILQLVKVEEYEEAKQLLDYFSRCFLEIDLQTKGITMGSLRIVTIAHKKAEEAVTSTGLPLEERIYHITSFRLAVDALSSDYHPLWLESKESVIHAIDAMKETVSKEDARAYQHRLNDFLRHYYMIRPALTIDIEPHHLHRLESQITFLEKHRNQFDVKILASHMSMLKEEWTNLYNQVKEDGADPSLWWVMITIGGMISLSLFYVGWRKYLAEKRKVRMKE